MKNNLRYKKTKIQHGDHRERSPGEVPLSVSDLQAGEKALIRCIQSESYSQEMATLQGMKIKESVVDRKLARKRNDAIKKTSSLYRLDPFIDEEGLLRVGGRIRRASVPQCVKHPVIIPRKSHLSC